MHFQILLPGQCSYYTNEATIRLFQGSVLMPSLGSVTQDKNSKNCYEHTLIKHEPGNQCLLTYQSGYPFTNDFILSSQMGQRKMETLKNQDQITFVINLTLASDPGQTVLLSLYNYKLQTKTEKMIHYERITYKTTLQSNNMHSFLLLSNRNSKRTYTIKRNK